MAHYAFLDENNIVTEVIVGIDETELIEGLSPEVWYGNFRGQVCKRTSYNTYRDIREIYAEPHIPEESLGYHENGQELRVRGEFLGIEDNGPAHFLGGTPFRGQFASVGDIYDFVTDTFISPPTPEVNDGNA